MNYELSQLFRDHFFNEDSPVIINRDYKVSVDDFPPYENVSRGVEFREAEFRIEGDFEIIHSGRSYPMWIVSSGIVYVSGERRLATHDHPEEHNEFGKGVEVRDFALMRWDDSDDIIIDVDEMEEIEEQIENLISQYI